MSPVFSHRRARRRMACPFYGLVLLFSLVAGCAPTGAGEPGDARRGARLFQSQACAACHTVADLPDARGQVGPDLSHVATLAESRVPGQDTETYLRTSLLFPNAFVVEGYAPNVMPVDYGQTLSRQQQRDLLAYLLTLR